MHSLWRHIIAHFTAAAMLLTSLTCMCQGAIFSSGDMCCHEAESARQLCCHDDDHDGHDGGVRDMDAREHSCNHCQGSLTIDSVGARNFAHLFDLKLSPLILELTTVATSSHATVLVQHFGDDPLPSSCAYTLLRQHCALNT